MESTNFQSGAVKDQLVDVTSSITPVGATGMQRDHESIDDFEHLDPESSPVKEFAGKGPQELLDKIVGMEQEMTVGLGKESLTSCAKAPESQNSSDFSLLSDSKLDSPLAENSPDFVEEMLLPASPANLPDIPHTFKANEKDLPDIPVQLEKTSPFASETKEFHEIPEKSQFDKESSVSGYAEKETDSQYPSDKLVAQSFMASEKEEKLAQSSISKDEKGKKFSEDLEFIKHESHPEPYKSKADLNAGNTEILNTTPDDNLEKITSEPAEFMEVSEDEPSFHTSKIADERSKDASSEVEPSPALIHIKDDMHDDDSFKDTDSIPEVKPGESHTESLPEDVKYYKPAHEDRDELEEDYDIPVVHTPINLADKLEQYQMKLPHELRTKGNEPEPELQPIGEYLPTEDSKVTEAIEEMEIQSGLPTNVSSTTSEPVMKPVSPLAKLNLKLTAESEPGLKTLTEKHDSEEVGEPVLLGALAFDAWFKPDRLHPKVVELVYWRDPKKSGILFGSVLGILLSLSYFSLISVVAYLSLAVLTGTISYRIYKNVMQALQKTSDGHPFKDILDLDLTLPQDKVREVTDNAVAHLNAAAAELRRLFLVEDLVDSIKFGILLWCLTYVGSWFNGMTLIIIAFVALFTLPKVYENNKTQIDQNVEIVRSKLAEVTAKVKTFNPMAKKPITEEKKEQ